MWQGVSPVPVQMWEGASPVPVQMWQGSPVPVQMWQGASPVPVRMWKGRAQSRADVAGERSPGADVAGERAQSEYALPPFKLSATNHDRAALGAHEIRVLPRGGVKHVVREDERHLPPRAGTQHAARAMQHGTWHTTNDAAEQGRLMNAAHGLWRLLFGRRRSPTIGGASHSELTRAVHTKPRQTGGNMQTWYGQHATWYVQHATNNMRHGSCSVQHAAYHAR